MINLGRRGLRQILLVGRRPAPAPDSARRLQFSSPRDALDLLRTLAHEPGHMALLRRLLADDQATARAFDRGDHQILEIVAHRLFTGALTATVVRPPEPDHQIGAPAPAEVAPGEAPEQEPRPSPIVPPEYIILARREASETTNGTRRLEAKLGKLGFLGFSRDKPPSQVAVEYPAVADAERMRVERSAFDLEAQIQQRRYAGYDQTRPPSVVADVFPKTAEAEHQRTSGEVTRLGQRIEGLGFERHDPNRARSEVSKEYPDVADAEVKHSRWAVGRLEEAVERLRHEPTRLGRASSALAQEYPSVARAGGRQVSNAIFDAGRALDALSWAKKEIDDTPPSQIAAELTEVARAQEKPVRDALGTLVEVMGKLAATEGVAREDRGQSAVAGEVRAVAGAQESRVRSALGSLVMEIGNLAAATREPRAEVPSRVAGEVRALSADQGRRAAAVVSSLSADLSKLLFSGEFSARARGSDQAK